MGDRSTNVSLGGNESAWGSGRSGVWEIKNARCRKIENARCRKHSSLVNRGAQRWYMNGGFTDPESMSDDPPLAQPPGILFSTLARDMTPFAKRYSLCLPN